MFVKFVPGSNRPLNESAEHLPAAAEDKEKRRIIRCVSLRVWEFSVGGFRSFAKEPPSGQSVSQPQEEEPRAEHFASLGAKHFTSPPLLQGDAVVGRRPGLRRRKVTRTRATRGVQLRGVQPRGPRSSLRPLCDGADRRSSLQVCDLRGCEPLQKVLQATPRDPQTQPPFLRDEAHEARESREAPKTPGRW